MSYGDGEAMPTGREKPGEHWNARIIREQNEIRNAAPAGDGGLREALEKLCDRYDRIAAELSIRGGVKATYDIPGSELRSVLAAHPAAPAVPQPVDREASGRSAERPLTPCRLCWPANRNR